MDRRRPPVSWEEIPETVAPTLSHPTPERGLSEAFFSWFDHAYGCFA